LIRILETQLKCDVASLPSDALDHSGHHGDLLDAAFAEAADVGGLDGGVVGLLGLGQGVGGAEGDGGLEARVPGAGPEPGLALVVD
jgi:hypothetical protein